MLTRVWDQQKEFDAILANRQVVARLNELEDLVADAARRRREAGGESGEPPVAYADLSSPLLTYPIYQTIPILTMDLFD
jgi:hypothetical protein